MGQGASEELGRDLQELHDNARYIEAFADQLHSGLKDLGTAATRTRAFLDGSEGGDDTFKDHARELMAMKYEIMRLCERVTLMRMDCENS